MDSILLIENSYASKTLEAKIVSSDICSDSGNSKKLALTR